jgi:hypothetical protein
MGLSTTLRYNSTNSLDCHYAESLYAECHYADVLSVVAPFRRYFCHFHGCYLKPCKWKGLFVIKRFCLYNDKSVWLDIQILYFKLQVIHMSYRQVLIPVTNSQPLLKLLFPDKFRLITFHKIQHKKTATL